MKITGLPARIAVALTDIVAIVDAAAGTPATWKATVAQIRSALLPIVLTGAADVSGALPVANIAPSGTNAQVLTTTGGVTVWAAPAAGGGVPTGTGFTHITLGAQDTSSKKVDLTAAADVLVPATVNGVVTSSGTVLQTATNVLAGANFVSIGGTPAAAGLIRVPNNAGAMMSVRDNTNATDWNLLKSSSVAGFVWGDPNANQSLVSFTLQLTAVSGQSIDTAVGANFVLLLTGTSIQVSQPIIGDTRGASPYGVHGGVAVSVTATPQALTAAQYAYDMIKLSTSTGAAFTVTTLAPASLAAGYYKTYWNTSAFAATISVGVGTTRTVIAGAAQRMWHDNSGVSNAGPSYTP